MGRPKQQHRVKTQKELAKVIGKSEDTICTWKKQGMPIEEDGTFDPMAVTEWRAERDRAKSKAGEDDREYQYWETRFRKSQALIAELKLSQLKGELLERSEVEGQFADWAGALQRRLMSLAPRLSQELAGLEPLQIQERIESELTELLDDIAESGVIEQ